MTAIHPNQRHRRASARALRHLPAGQRSRKAGFSLAELMVVIVIIGLLATLVVPNVVKRLATAFTGKAKADITSIAGALDEYYINNGGQWPDTLEVLVTPDENGHTYLKSRKLPVDPWKNEYGYEPPSASEPRPKIFTYGKDGMVGGEGENRDISNWDIESGDA